ncbi:MAG TPA: multicopper oxidase domain-containing protein [Candidatus Methylomirabilis sp.]|nr:multicopper oxidase domain-containing protein [Candidatus Methylomirabilis sp.]
MSARERVKMSRRNLLKMGLMTGGASLFASRALAQVCVDQTPFDIAQAINSCQIQEVFPTSPFILQPFSEAMPIPSAMRPGWRQPDGTLDPDYSGAWSVRVMNGRNQNYINHPGPGPGQQDALGARPRVAGGRFAGGQTYQLPDAGTHQLYPGTPGTVCANYPEPIYYHIRYQVRQASFTSSPVLPINKDGQPVTPPRNVVPMGGKYYLPPSTIYGMNGTFPGPMVNVEYGKPVILRFENDLDYNPLCLDRQDFGAPDWAFLTHLHNGHTAAESDGQPHHMTDHDGGYQPGEWCDNLYLNYPAGGDDREKQSFLWFHDHRMHHTGPNVYKGMVGLMPHYDPILDNGDETRGLRLPGRRVNNPDGSFDVKYDIPFALYDCVMDDGVTQHADFHNGCGELHPEWWGQLFHRHFPNHGFVGDIFTVNGKAYPVLHVYQRKYRFRFLDCSVSRIYQLWLMRSGSGPAPKPGMQGQWGLPDGQQCMRFTQIASEGGLLPAPIVRNSFELWPAKRREFVVDFTKYMDGSPTRPGDVIYLVNSLAMPTGRIPDNFPPDPNKVKDSRTLVPMVKIVIEGPPPEPDLSVIPSRLRDMPPLPINLSSLPQRRFVLEHGSPANGSLVGSGETEWLINGLQFDPLNPLALPTRGQPEIWTVQNGGGGWVHPMHMHMEEHHVLSRNGVPAPDSLHPDDTGREDVAALYPSEAVTFYRNFRTFKGKYVAHCHNLAHEDHNMMFGWAIV